MVQGQRAQYQIETAGLERQSEQVMLLKADFRPAPAGFLGDLEDIRISIHRRNRNRQLALSAPRDDSPGDVAHAGGQVEEVQGFDTGPGDKSPHIIQNQAMGSEVAVKLFESVQFFK